MLDRLPPGEGRDMDAVGALARRCHDTLAALRDRVVSFDEVRDALGGSWGDSDLAAEASAPVAELYLADARHAAGAGEAPPPRPRRHECLAARHAFGP